MIWHFSVHRYVPLCQIVAKNDHLLTTNELDTVNCEGCLEIVDDIAKKAGIIRPPHTDEPAE